MRRSTVVAAAAAALFALPLAGCGQAGSAVGSSAASGSPAGSGAGADSGSGGGSGTAVDTSVPGAYLTEAEYEADPAARAGTVVVYFFHAPWCPDCRATEESLTRDGVPAGLTVVKVDFDTATALRQKYGVTVQHTFVRVDGSGAKVGAFTGAFSGAEILAEAT